VILKKTVLAIMNWFCDVAQETEQYKRISLEYGKEYEYLDFCGLE
jgi:hypothetical protein